MHGQDGCWSLHCIEVVGVMVLLRTQVIGGVCFFLGGFIGSLAVTLEAYE
jgi:hypothetical protein